MTIKWYSVILCKFANRYPKLPTRPELIEDFIIDTQAGDERKHGYFRTLRCFYRFLHKRFQILNPMDCIEPPRRKRKNPRILSPDELDQLLCFPHPPEIKAALLFLCDTGTRLGELANLKEMNIQEMPWGYIAKLNGKTGERPVPLSVETYHALVQNLPFGYSKDYLGRKIAQAFKDAHIKGTAHTLRHTFATLWEGDELALQNILGHTSLSTTKIYRHLRSEILSSQHRQFSPLKMVFARSKSML